MSFSTFSFRRLGLAALWCVIAFTPASHAVGRPTAAPSGIELGLQCWTFRSFTFFETLDMAADLGVKHLQIYPGQTIGGGLTGTIGPDLSSDQRRTIRGWLKDRGLDVVSVGVAGASDEVGWKALVDFARDMGARTIATEAEAEMFPMINRVLKGTGISVALHNHPTPSRYADPATALAAIKSFGSQFGLCADTGHWTRDVRDPVACLRMAKGRLLELHFKDVSEQSRRAHDMPWGTGVSNAAGQIAELRRQGFSGYVFVEYEFNTAALEADVARCIGFFRAALRAPIEELETGGVAPPGYTRNINTLWRDRSVFTRAKWPSPQPLLQPDLSNAEYAEGSWVWEGDVLVAKGGGNLWTKESFSNFALSLEFKVDAGGESGVLLRTSDTVNWMNNAVEVQILQGDSENPRHVVGSIFDVCAPERQRPIEPGTWHQFVIVAEAGQIVVRLDGEQVVKMDLNAWSTVGKNPDETTNSFEKAYRDMPREGRIGLQYQGAPVSFRNILIERL